MPGSFQTSSVGGVPRTGGIPVVAGFQNSETPYFEYPYVISGVTRDAGGVPLPNCDVVLFRSADNSVAGITVSDENGNFLISASPNIQHYIVAYLNGAPDVAGTSDDGLVGA